MQTPPLSHLSGYPQWLIPLAFLERRRSIFYTPGFIARTGGAKPQGSQCHPYRERSSAAPFPLRIPSGGRLSRSDKAAFTLAARQTGCDRSPFPELTPPLAALGSTAIRVPSKLAPS